MVEYMMRKKDHKYLILVKILANPVAYIDVLQTEKPVSMWRTTGLSDLSQLNMWSASLYFYFFILRGCQKLFYLQCWEQVLHQCLKSVFQVPSCLKSAILLTKHCCMYRISC